MKVLLIDNHDSFTYNLVQLLKQCGAEPVIRNPESLPCEELSASEKILISPGPGIPSETGILINIIRQVSSSASVLGICLGHQAIAETFGARLINARKIYHGEEAEILPQVKDYFLFRGLPDSFPAGRYHSWIVDPLSLPPELEITASDKEGEIMGLRHKQFDLHGVQFHPESILTPSGKIIISNWLR